MKVRIELCLISLIPIIFLSFYLGVLLVRTPPAAESSTEEKVELTTESSMELQIKEIKWVKWDGSPPTVGQRYRCPLSQKNPFCEGKWLYIYVLDIKKSNIEDKWYMQWWYLRSPTEKYTENSLNLTFDGEVGWTLGGAELMVETD